jgi:hypothetical protein
MNLAPAPWMTGTLLLLTIRIFTIAIAAAINILVIKILPLQDVGQYYMIATISYFGNAIFFIGFDLAFQKKIQDISVTKALDFSSLRLYILKTLPYGILASFGLSLIVSFVSGSDNWLIVASLCAGLAVSNYLSSILRNILLIADEKYRVSYSLLLEQLIKITFFSLLFVIFRPSPLLVIISFVAASVIAFVFNFYQIRNCLSDVSVANKYTIDSSNILMIVLPVGAAGVLNWMQLQGYRPILGNSLQGAELVGIVSFLTVLGSGVTSAILGVIAQVWTPRQFATKGGLTHRFISISIFSIIVLSLLSYPVSYILLRMLGKEGLYGFEYLVSLGVLLEGGNFILGILGNHSILTSGSFVPSLLAGISGFCTVAIIILAAVFYHQVGPGMIGFALALSQCIAVAALLTILLKRNIV